MIRVILIALVASMFGINAVSPAAAQAYPSRPVKILVGLSAGGSTDVVARIIAQWLTERIGQSFIVENKPGAATNIATETVVRAPADGYTLIAISSTSTINSTLYDKLSFSLIRDIAPVALMVRVPIVLEVNPSFPVNTIPEFIAYAKANPGKMSMALPGNGTPAHVSAEMFKIQTGVDILPVQYRGDAPALTDLLGGQVQSLFAALPTSLDLIKSGKLRALATASKTRLDLLPNTPTIAEFLPGFEASYWIGIGAPRNTPVEVIAKLNKEINAALVDPATRERLIRVGGTVFSPVSPGDFQKLIVEDTEKWGKVVRAAKLTPN